MSFVCLDAVEKVKNYLRYLRNLCAELLLRREEQFFLATSVFIGVMAGLAVVCFRCSIAWVHAHLMGVVAHPSVPRLFLTPVLCGLVIAVLVIHFFPQARGNGVNQTRSALYISNGYIPLRNAVGKFFLAALSIGSGFSLGPEDPSLQVGACLASATGRWVGFSRHRRRLLAPVGAAAGLAAAFNAPVSAVLYVIEEVIGRWSAGILGSVVLAAVSSVVVMRSFMGSQPLFKIPSVQMDRPSELLAYAVLGVVGGLVSVLFASLITTLRPRCRNLPAWTQYFQPALAGLLVALVAWLGAPQVMGAGYEAMDQAMHGAFTWQFLAILVGAKLLATLISFVSGTPGGLFAPALFVGAMLGAAVGDLQHVLLPQLSWSMGTYALVCMGVLFAGFLRVPMTSVFMILEVSGNYSIILPVIIANSFSYFISRMLMPVPLFDQLSRQEGVELPTLEEEREAQILRVEDAMRRPKCPVMDAEKTVAEVAQALGTHKCVLVRMQPTGWSLAGREEIALWVQEGRALQSLGERLEDRAVPAVYPDQQLDTVLYYTKSSLLIPVVSRVDPSHLEGVVAERDVLEVYAMQGADQTEE